MSWAPAQAERGKLWKEYREKHEEDPYWNGHQIVEDCEIPGGVELLREVLAAHPAKYPYDPDTLLIDRKGAYAYNEPDKSTWPLCALQCVMDELIRERSGTKIPLSNLPSGSASVCIDNLVVTPTKVPRGLAWIEGKADDDDGGYGDIYDEGWPQNTSHGHTYGTIRIDYLAGFLKAAGSSKTIDSYDPVMIKRRKTVLGRQKKDVKAQDAKTAKRRADDKKESDAKTAASIAKAGRDEAEAQRKKAAADHEIASTQLTIVQTEKAEKEIVLMDKQLEVVNDQSEMVKMQLAGATRPIQHTTGDDIVFTMDGDVTVGTLPIVMMRDGVGVKTDVKIRRRNDGRYNGKSISNSLGVQLKDILKRKAVKTFVDSQQREHGIARSELVVYDDGVPWLSGSLVNAIVWSLDPNSGHKYMPRIMSTPSGEYLPRTQLVEALDKSIELASITHDIPVDQLVTMQLDGNKTTDAWYDGIDGIDGDGFAVAASPLSSGKSAVEILEPMRGYPSLISVIDNWEAVTSKSEGKRSLIIYPFERIAKDEVKKSALETVRGALGVIDGVVREDAYKAFVVPSASLHSARMSVLSEMCGIAGVSSATMKIGM